MNLRNQVLDAVKWSVAGRLASQLVTWAITIYVIRLLSPSDYGLMALAGIFATIFSMVAEIGLGAALVRSQDLSPFRIRQIFGIVILSSLVACLVLATLVAYLAGEFFNDPRLVGVIQLLSLQFLPSIFIVIPSALLNRNMMFRGRAIIDLTSTIAGALLTLFLAYTDHGVYSLVWGSIMQIVIRAVGLNIAQPFCGWPIFKFSGCGGMFKFGGNVTGSQLVWMLYSQADIFFIGRFLGNNVLGIYSVAMDLASLPAARLSAILNQIVYPALARVQREGESVGPYLLKGIRVVSLISIPIMWGMSSISNELIDILLGVKWQDSKLPFTILCVIMPFRVQSPLMHAGLHAVGRAFESFQITCITAFLMTCSFIVGVQFGLLGISIAWGVVFPTVFLIFFYRACNKMGFPGIDLIISLIRPILAGVLMFAAVCWTRYLLPQNLNSVMSMILLIFIGAFVYISITFMINRQGVNELRSIVSSRS